MSGIYIVGVIGVDYFLILDVIIVLIINGVNGLVVVFIFLGIYMEYVLILVINGVFVVNILIF